MLTFSCDTCGRPEDAVGGVFNIYRSFILPTVVVGSTGRTEIHTRGYDLCHDCLKIVSLRARKGIEEATPADRIKEN